MTRTPIVTSLVVFGLAGFGCHIERKPAASPYLSDAGLDGWDEGDGPGQDMDTGADEDAEPGDATDMDGPSRSGQDAGASGDSAVDHDGDPGSSKDGGGGSGEGASDAAAEGSEPGDAGQSEDDGSGSGASPASCRQALGIIGCNPITNMGCAPELGMQCAVDLLAPSPVGYCTFSAPQDPATGVACLNTGVTESCPPTQTCFGGACRPLCLCDDDCQADQCCTEPVGSGGFRVCGDC